MVLASDDEQLLIGRFIDKAVFVCDAARPISF
jgi:hypothetical protein